MIDGDLDSDGCKKQMGSGQILNIFESRPTRIFALGRDMGICRDERGWMNDLKVI